MTDFMALVEDPSEPEPYASAYTATIHLASGATVVIRDTDRQGGVEVALTDGDTGETVIADLTHNESFRITSSIAQARG
jgi:hypothetical protein